VRPSSFQTDKGRKSSLTADVLLGNGEGRMDPCTAFGQVSSPRCESEGVTSTGDMDQVLLMLPQRPHQARACASILQGLTPAHQSHRQQLGLAFWRTAWLMCWRREPRTMAKAEKAFRRPFHSVCVRYKDQTVYHRDCKIPRLYEEQRPRRVHHHQRSQ
jgi:hypothetical protein